MFFILILSFRLLFHGADEANHLIQLIFNLFFFDGPTKAHPEQPDGTRSAAQWPWGQVLNYHFFFVLFIALLSIV